MSLLKPPLTPRRIASIADIERIESRPYVEFMPHTSVYDALAGVAARHAERTALTFIESAGDNASEPERAHSWTYSQFIGEVRRAANLFASLAAPEEPRVAMLLPAIPEAFFTLWGAEAAGVACPINYLLDAAHVGELIRASKANILVALGPNAALDIWSRVSELRAQCPGLRHVLVVGGEDGAHIGDATDFASALAAQPSATLTAPRTIDAATLAALFHTGGTTGAPKLAQHLHGNQLHSAWSAAQMYAMDEHDVMLSGFPLFHVAGSLVYGLSTLLSGAELVLPTLLGMRNARFVPHYWNVVARHRVTLLAAVPTVMSTIVAIDPKGADIASVRALYTGGSPLPPELAASFEQRFGIPVRNILGMTECAGIVSVEPLHGARVAGSCGLRLPFTTVEAVTASGPLAGQVCDADRSGILRLRGPNVGPGYTDARRDAGTFDDGWLSTGDIGQVDAQGRLFITGRAKDVIIRGGHNIEPGVIEEALMRHPDVQFAAAVGEPDEYAGEMPMAFVVLKPGATVSEAALIEFASRHIPERPAFPKRIDVLTSLPLTAVGKVYKPALRLRAIEHVIADRLARAGLSGRVGVQGCDGEGGLSIVFTATSDLEAALRAVMARFAIPWTRA